jgi:hypothetical protein
LRSRNSTNRHQKRSALNSASSVSVSSPGERGRSPRVGANRDELPNLIAWSDWEIIADNLSRVGFSWGCVSTINSNGQTIWIVDAHGYGKRFIVRADEILTAFVELERAIHEFAVSSIS